MGQASTEWTIIFCQSCGEPTPPSAGMKTNFGFLCDYCMNTDAFPTNTILPTTTDE